MSASKTAVARPTPSVAGLLSRTESSVTPVPEWLTVARRAAADWAIGRGFPTRKDEDWKYTPLAPLITAAVEHHQNASAAPVSRDEIDRVGVDSAMARITFVNGIFAPGLSVLADLPSGVSVGSLASDLAGGADLESFFSPTSGQFGHAFEAVNTAMADDGAVVRIAADTNVDGLIELMFWSDDNGTPGASQPRSIIFAGANSRVSFVENYAGRSGCTGLTNAVTQVVVDEGAHVDRFQIQDGPDTGFHLGLLDVRQNANSRFSSLSVALGSRIGRDEVRVRLLGEGADASLSGLYLPGGERHHDNPVLVVHSAPNCTSRQLYKGIATDRGHGVFNGHLVVLPGADGTDASQTNKNLLLSDHAEIDTRPRLEILTDDVKCTHGAAVGALDPDAIFYLRSRGVPLHQAQAILTTAFAGEILDLVPLDGLRAHLEGLVTKRLSDEAGFDSDTEALR